MKIKILIELPLSTYIDVVANQIFDVPVVGGVIIAGHRISVIDAEGGARSEDNKERTGNQAANDGLYHALL